ncbi:MAG: hypothetical protein DRJ59_07480 [Thermoprotei archaeon]|nr:MAG: hypothetical protein DRJ59_07480 [Thermoprotei archaeon]
MEENINRKIFFIVDFDGTIVKENSSIILAQLIISSLTNSLARVFYKVLLFLLPRLSPMLWFLSMLRNNDIDLVRYLIVFRLIHKNNIDFAKVSRISARLLTLKNNVLELLHDLVKKYDCKIIILSAGVRDIIDAFLHRTLISKQLKIKTIVATTIIKKNPLTIREITKRSKVRVLSLIKRKYGNKVILIYISDSINELKLIRNSSIARIILINVYNNGFNLYQEACH